MAQQEQTEPSKTAHKISLFIADVDGALVTKDKILTDRARKAVHDLHDAGIQFAITSGRPPRGMKMLVAPLDLHNPIAGFNGGMFVKPDLTIIEQHTIPKEVAPQIVETIKNHNLDVWVYKGNDWYIQKKDAPHVDREEWTVKFPPTVVQSYDDLYDGAIKIVGISDDLDAVARCEKDTQAQFGNKVSAARSQPYYLDVTHPDANKGHVAEWLSKFLNIPENEIATIGDQPNDVLMFKKSGLSIAMGNASPEVQAQATKVTTSYEDEGFANAVERFVFGRE
jgi:Cof subfamily protein (haloacid dehalogenase superfamily)